MITDLQPRDARPRRHRRAWQTARAHGRSQGSGSSGPGLVTTGTGPVRPPSRFSPQCRPARACPGAAHSRAQRWRRPECARSSEAAGAGLSRKPSKAVIPQSMPRFGPDPTALEDSQGIEPPPEPLKWIFPAIARAKGCCEPPIKSILGHRGKSWPVASNTKSARDLPCPAAGSSLARLTKYGGIPSGAITRPGRRPRTRYTKSGRA